MSGEERRAAILEKMKAGSPPVSGTALAKELQVSRQVIVQDIALLRAAGYEIFSTNRGYLIQTPVSVSRIFKVYHQDQDILEELNAIVDFGGVAEDVFVHHRVYGTLRAALGIRSRRQVEELARDISNGKSTPLKNVTSGYHYHTVSAESEEILDQIEAELKRRGFLVESRREEEETLR